MLHPTNNAAQEPPSLETRLAGALLGTAVGDALGLPYENLKPARIAKLTGARPLRYRLLPGRGLVSDDTEHACIVGQALLRSRGAPAPFARALARGLRGWFLTLPAGLGFGTLRACVKLCLGFPPSRSGVFTAGNGPAMRAPLLGAFAADEAQLRALVHASTVITHTDPRAEVGARVIALAAHRAPGTDSITLLDGLIEEARAAGGPAAGGPAAGGPAAGGPLLADSLVSARAALARGDSAGAYAASLGLEHGVTGFIDHTVPAAIYCWLRHRGDLRAAVEAAVRLGGDTDTVAAITGGVAGADLGADAIPKPWLDGLVEWPRDVRWMRGLAARLAQLRAGRSPGPQRWFWPGVFPRNALFLSAVLLHALRRLLPPY